MTPTLELVDNSTLVISSTQLDEIKTCSRRWWFRYGYRRIPAYPNSAAQAGKAFDSALNWRYQKLGNKPVDPQTEGEQLALIDKAFEGVELPLEEHRTPARFKEVVKLYNEFYKQEPFEVLGVQVPFAVPLGVVEAPQGFFEAVIPDHDARLTHLMTHGKPLTHVQVVLHGLLDLFIRIAGHVLIVDTKTSNSLSEATEIGYENSSQMKAYCWSLPELARLNPGQGLPERVHGCFVNAVCVRPPYKYEDRKPTAKDRPRTEFKRMPITLYTPERLEEWRQDTLLHVEQALGWVARGHFPQNEKSCPLHYGKPCGYLRVCGASKSQREDILASDLYMNYERGPLAGVEAPKEEPCPECQGTGQVHSHNPNCPHCEGSGIKGFTRSKA